MGAVLGPLVALALVQADVPLRWIFAVAAIPGALSVVAIVILVREHRETPQRTAFRLSLPASPAFRWLLAGSLLFAVGNSSDTFILLKAQDVGMSTSAVILFYVLYNVVYAAGSLPLGGLSDRVGQYPVVIAGYLVFAAVYAGFAAAGSGWTLAALFAAYGLYIAATEGTSKALIGRAIPTGRARLRARPVLHGHRPRDVRREHRGRPALERLGAVGDVRLRGGWRRSSPPASCWPAAGASAARSRRRSPHSPAERGPARSGAGRAPSFTGGAGSGRAYGAAPVAP